MFPFGLRFHKKRGLRFWIVSLLARTPRNGAELMDTIDGMSQGWWRPSPGSIYPILEDLVKDGVVSKRNDGRYELTEAGKEQISWPFGAPPTRARGVEEIVDEIAGYASYLEDLRKSDRSKVAGSRDSIRKLAERLSALVREGGESE
jgi:DNA-binding PadR family transcriptional regulator